MNTMNQENLSALKAFAATDPSYYEPSPTMSLSEATLLAPASPRSFRSSSVAASVAASEDKKPAKKRKSWGQELPTPKTNLPPRKRAKTEDEKEQRRIERVLRNRQAAQSSRERKRLEVEKLEGEKCTIEQQNKQLRERVLFIEQEKYLLKQQVAKLTAALGQKASAEAGTPASPISLPDLFQEDSMIDIKQEIEEHQYSLPSPIPSHRGSIDPRSELNSSRSPSPSRMDCEQMAAPVSDMAQHPAEMLCGLQCQSQAERQPSTSQPLPWPRDEARFAAREPQASAILLLYLKIHMTVFLTALNPLSQLLASLKKGSSLRPQRMTPVLFHLILWLISTPTLTIRTLATPTTSSPLTSAMTKAETTSSSSSPRTRPATFRTSLLRRFLSCSPALARPLKDATVEALRMKASDALRGRSDRSRSTDDEGREGADSCGDDARARSEVWRLMTMAIVIDQWQKERKRSGKSIEVMK